MQAYADREHVNRSAFAALSEFQPTRTFALFHYLQPHAPSDPPAEFRTPLAPDNDDGAVVPTWEHLEKRRQKADRLGRTTRRTIELIESRYRAIAQT